MPFCVNCGSKLEAQQRFCAECGTPAMGVEPAAAVLPVPRTEDAGRTVPVPQTLPGTQPFLDNAPGQQIPEEEEDPFFAIFAKVNAQDFSAQSAPKPVYTPPAQQSDTSGVQQIPPQPAYMPPVQQSEPAYWQQQSAQWQAPYAPPAQPKAAKPRGALAAVVSVLLCLGLLVSMLPLFSLLTARSVLTQETMLAVMRRMDLDEIPAWQLESNYADDKDLSLADILCEGLNEAVEDAIGPAIWGEFTPDSLKRFMRETTFPEFVARQGERLLKAVLAGDEEFSIRVRDVEKVLMENREYLSEELGIEVEEQLITIAAEEFLASSGFDGLELGRPDEDTERALETVNKVLSSTALLCAVLVIAVQLALLAAVNWRHPRYALRGTGVVCVLGTVLPLMAAAAFRLLIGQFAGSNAIGYICCVLSSCVLERVLPVYLLVFGAGVVLLVVAVILKKVKK